MGIEATATALKTQLATQLGSNIKAVYAPNALPVSISSFPSAVILWGEVNYLAAFGDKYDFKLRVIVLMSKSNQPSGLNKLADFIEATGGGASVPSAVAADRTLAGNCSSAVVSRNMGTGVTEWGGESYLSTEFEVQIYGL